MGRKGRLEGAKEAVMVAVKEGNKGSGNQLCIALQRLEVEPIAKGS